MNGQVIHNTAKNRFELTVDGGTVVADYDLSPGTIAFTHTVTPSSLRGRGLAAVVVKTALEYARDQKLKVVPMCWYVAEYINKHPEFQPLTAR